ncbi:BLUF domain-containing protein [Xanthomonas phaseoli]|uniref:BLUF domain-containing protein n=1 Tax=Xanthomonas phaseoli TaxID=1985254 RepID=UPI000473611C|nr:BLUF domain-containing protein [Xanthomonas phaseoli]
MTIGPLHAIAYVSEVRRPWTLAEVDRLLVSSSALNAQNAITGVLLYDGRRFFQYIEGSPTHLRDTYDRIKRSSRHDLVAELYSDQITERYFPQWQMACRKVLPGSIVEVSAQRWNRARLALTVAGEKPKAIQHLLSFWEGSELVLSS